VGWAASFAGFISCVVYNILLGVSMIYLVQSGSQPWKEENLKRPSSCSKSIPAAEIYLYMNVTKAYDETNCKVFQYDKTDPKFNVELFVAVAVTWVICFLCVVGGPKSIGYVTSVTVILPFILLFVLLGKFVSLNNENGGKGFQYYLGGESIIGKDGTLYDPAKNLDDIITDAYNQVFYSVGVCVGVMYAYGSYNKLRKPVIQDAIIISLTDFVFSILAGFIAWGAIGYLIEKDDQTALQTNSTGLAFIAMPTSTSTKDDDQSAWFTVFALFVVLAGIDTALSFVEGFVTNIIDATGWKRPAVAGFVCLLGIAVSSIFTTNFGWLLFDLVDHYISAYIIIAIGILQCVSVGWQFEQTQTQSRSPHHQKSSRLLGLFFWFPVITGSFFLNFAIKGTLAWGPAIFIPTTAVAFIVSKSVSKMPMNQWYYEIVLCGVNKLSMSLTDITDESRRRRWWMQYFEGYFGIMIKFVNPAVLIYMFFSNMADDMDEPYGGQPVIMQMYAAVFVYLTASIIVTPIFMCDYAEVFTHNVAQEFNADDRHELRVKFKNMLKGKALKLDKGKLNVVDSRGARPDMEMNSTSLALN